jgi:hypothetical protein
VPWLVQVKTHIDTEIADSVQKALKDAEVGGDLQTKLSAANLTLLRGTLTTKVRGAVARS